MGKNLPIVVTKTTYHEIRRKKELLTVDTAEKKAYDKYMEYKEKNLSEEDEILSETLSFSQSEEGIRLTVTLILSENVAVSSPFSFVEVP